VWIGVTGLALVAIRLGLEHKGRPPLPASLLLSASVACAVSIRLEFGYFAGREPCVALLFLLIGLKLLEAKQERDATSLLCLAAFLATTQFFYAQNLLAALAALPCLLAVSAGLLVTQGNADAVSWRSTLAAATRMLLHGIPLAFIFFLLFPRISGPLWGIPTDNLSRPGLSDTMEPGTIRDLTLTDDVAFRVDFESEVPAYGERYWRGPVLSYFDGTVWRSAPSIPRPESTLPHGGPVTAYTVTMEPNSQRYFLALDLPASIPPEAYTTPAFELLGRAPITRQLRYRQLSVLRSRYSTGTPPPRFDVGLPRERNARTRAWASELRARYPEDGALAAAVLQRFYQDNFIYSLQATALGDNAIDEFLFETKKGFCEHYASSFVYVLRAAGIPARVVTGYQGGEMNYVGGLEYMIVRQSDAHAWAEAWIDGAWQRFDPTAAVAPARIQRGLGAALGAGERIPFLARLDASWLRNLRLGIDAMNYGWQRWVVGFNTDRQRALWNDAGLGDASTWKLILGMTFGVLLAGGLLAALVLVRPGRRDPVVSAWDRLCARLAGAGLPRRANEGPLAYAGRACMHWPEHAAVLRSAALAYCLLRYGTVSGRDEDAWATLNRALRRLPGAATLRRARTPSGS
jgi:transglutaminase-like putative cysteine protease